MDVDVTILLYLIVPAVSLGWVLKRIGLFEVIGFIIGGGLSYYFLKQSGLPVENIIEFTEPLQMLGLILFSFEIGASLNLRGVVKSIKTIISAELILLAISWISSGIVSQFLGLTSFERLLILLLLINSSTFTVVALQKIKISNEAYERSVLQTSLEDVLQFSLFSLLIMTPIAVSTTPIQVLTRVVQVAGSILLIFILARTAMIMLSKSPVVRSKLDKFFVLIATALLFSAVASLLNLPELLGSFIAGLAASLYIDLEDIQDMIKGFRELGLLLYFTSIGIIITPWLTSINSETLISTIVVAFILLFTRILGLVIGFAISGLSLQDSISTSIILSPISETGIIFTHILYKIGYIDPQLVVVTAMITTISIIVSSPLIYRIHSVSVKLESLLPRSIVSAIDIMSKMYQKRIDFLINISSTIIWFSALSLLITSLTSFTCEILIVLKTPMYSLTILLISSIAMLLLVYAISMRRITHVVIENLSKLEKARSLVILGSVIDFLMLFIAISLQIYMLYEYISKYSTLLLVLEHNILMYIVTSATIIITIHIAFHHYRKIPKTKQ